MIDMTYTNIRYSVMLNDAQYDYLMDKSQEIDRMMCFRTFLKMAVMVQTKVEKKNFSAVLQPGQLMASKVELSLLWQCNRKTATRIVQEFNQMGFLHSEPSNRTTIHTLKFLSEWVADEGTVENSFFDNNPMVMPIGKQDKDVHVPPMDEREPTENDNRLLWLQLRHRLPMVMGKVKKKTMPTNLPSHQSKERRNWLQNLLLPPVLKMPLWVRMTNPVNRHIKRKSLLTSKNPGNCTFGI